MQSAEIGAAVRRLKNVTQFTLRDPTVNAASTART
jgi:hypothetical protein